LKFHGHVSEFDAKTHFSDLLDKVEAGEEIVITRHGRAVARIMPEEAVAGQRLDETIGKLKQMRAGNMLGGLPSKKLRNEGRK
jgi:prevent-host-death family protein